MHRRDKRNRRIAAGERSGDGVAVGHTVAIDGDRGQPLYGATGAASPRQAAGLPGGAAVRWTMGMPEEDAMGYSLETFCEDCRRTLRDAPGQPGDTYLGMMRFNAEQIAAGLAE